MSDHKTPRTVAEQFYAASFEDDEWVVPVEFAEQLEIEIKTISESLLELIAIIDRVETKSDGLLRDRELLELNLAKSLINHRNKGD